MGRGHVRYHAHSVRGVRRLNQQRPKCQMQSWFFPGGVDNLRQAVKKMADVQVFCRMYKGVKCSGWGIFGDDDWSLW